MSSKGSAGKGKFHHAVGDSLTVGDQIITFFNIYESNGESATYSPRATVLANDNIYYPTGTGFAAKGTSQNTLNILTNTKVANGILPDLAKIRISALDKAVGLEHNDILYFALPVGSDENNEIWYMDTSRNNLWVLRWTVAAKDMWLYEDNDGFTHFCVLSDNKILEFTRAGATPTTDDGVAFKTRLAFSALVWDPDGITLANIYRQYFNLLQPRGKITVNTYGLKDDGLTTAAGSGEFISTVSHTGIGDWDYSGDYMFGDDPGAVESYSQSQGTITVKPSGLLNQLEYEVITDTAGCDYFLSSVNTRGKGNDNLIRGD